MEPPPRPSAELSTPSGLRRELLELHAWAGAPSARRLAAVAAGLGLTLARSTTQDQINPARVAAGLPSRDFVQAFVSACLTHAGLDAGAVAREVPAWDRAWLAVVSAHGQIPAAPGTNGQTSGRPEKIRARSRFRVILGIVGVIAVFGGGFLTAHLLADPRPNEQATDQIQDVNCVPDGLATTWQNHHSLRYLIEHDGSVVIDPRGMTVEAVFTARRVASSSLTFCVQRLVTPTGHCLAARGTEVRQASCAESPDQHWVIENHWEHEGVMWQRVHAAGHLGLCLQPQSGQSSPPRAELRTCNFDWVQQWRMEPAVRPSR